MSTYDYAKLRPVEVKAITHQGEPFFYLRDPLELSPHYALLPQHFGIVLAACDGTRTILQVQQTVEAQTGGLHIAETDIEHLLSQLDQILLLDNASTAEALTQALSAYRTAPFRPPTLAGVSYPAEPDSLRRELQAFIDAAPPIEEIETGRGVFSPHIDYHRGGPVYAQVWKRAAKLARDADCVIIFGTDHNSALPGQITPTRQNYATPFGTLLTNQTVIDAIVEVLGEETAFAEELHHRNEHSIELAAVWLHFIREGKPVSLVPVLCGGFYHFISNGGSPATDSRLNDVLAAIDKTTAGQKVLVVGAGDLAHLGPVFSTPPLDTAAQARLKTDDNILMKSFSLGNPDAAFELIRQEQGERNVCGTAPFYLTMKLIGETTGEIVSYDRCPADEHNTSFVSVCGMVFS